MKKVVLIFFRVTAIIVLVVITFGVDSVLSGTWENKNSNWECCDEESESFLQIKDTIVIGKTKYIKNR